MGSFDLTTDHGKRADQHLNNDQVVWLTTVSPKGAPLPSPVWFLWDGETILVHSQPDTPKARSIRANSRVSLNFNSTPSGDDVVVISGAATLVNEGTVSATSAAYNEKYASGLEHLGKTPESFAAEYSQLIRIVPTGLRGF